MGESLIYEESIKVKLVDKGAARSEQRCPEHKFRWARSIRLWAHPTRDAHAGLTIFMPYHCKHWTEKNYSDSLLCKFNNKNELKEEILISIWNLTLKIVFNNDYDYDY